jgi:hypothetical protein
VPRRAAFHLNIVHGGLIFLSSALRFRTLTRRRRAKSGSSPAELPACVTLRTPGRHSLKESFCVEKIRRGLAELDRPRHAVAANISLEQRFTTVDRYEPPHDAILLWTRSKMPCLPALGKPEEIKGKVLRRARQVFCSNRHGPAAKELRYSTETTLMLFSMRTQRAGRLSPGTTSRSGPSFSAKGLLSAVSTTSTCVPLKSASSSASEKTAR